jgi:hypothetical protein
VHFKLGPGVPRLASAYAGFGLSQPALPMLPGYQKEQEGHSVDAWCKRWAVLRAFLSLFSVLLPRGRTYACYTGTAAVVQRRCLQGCHVAAVAACRSKRMTLSMSATSKPVWTSAVKWLQELPVSPCLERSSCYGRAAVVSRWATSCLHNSRSA